MSRNEEYNASPKPLTVIGVLPGLSTLSLILIGICATTSSGLANARNCTDFTLGVLTPSLDFKTTFPIIYLDTSAICFSSSPVPDTCVKALINVAVSGLSKSSNFVVYFKSTEVLVSKAIVDISAPTNCLDSAVKKSAADNTK